MMTRWIILILLWAALLGGAYFFASGQGIIPQRQQAIQLAGGVQLPGIDLWGLDADNTLWLRRACDVDFRRQIRIQPFASGEAIIGIDYRPSDGYLYALSDAGSVYQVMTLPPGQGTTVLISQTSPRFPSGYQSLMDFNPVLDALRLIGTDDSNFALVNSGGNLNVTAVQTAITYAANDPAAGANPNLTGGAYTNNVVGALTTLFYGLDYDRDTLITITPGANGSSATGGGQLTTIGRLRRQDGTMINITPTADCDIYTDASGNNLLIGVSGRALFTLDLANVLPGQDVTVRASDLRDGGLIDVAAVRSRFNRCQ